METLIERLSERAHDSQRATDEGRSVAAPPATEAEIAATERALGVRLPALLRRLYREVGNGGFGPGDGLLGLPASEAGASALPRGLISICEWGSGIISCLDCSGPDAPVVRLDPNMPKADVRTRVPAALHYARAPEVGVACWLEAASLEGWLEAWADGKRLFYAAYGGAEPEEDLDEDSDEDFEDDDTE